MKVQVSIGDRYGYWQVMSEPYIKRVGKTKPVNRKFVQCICTKCGIEKEVRLEDMARGKSTKCKACNKTERAYTNEYIDSKDDCHILRVASMKTGESWDFIFDSKFLEKISKHYWGVVKSNNNIYLRASGRKNKCLERLHRYIYYLEYDIKLKTDEVIDHINRNTLDTRVSNLNLVTPLENAQNASIRKDNISGVKGVSWDKYKSKWIAYIQFNKKSVYLGSYINKEDAIKARREAEIKYHRYNEEISKMGA